MGGWMTYKRMRDRNGIGWHTDAEDYEPYPPAAVVETHRDPSWYMVVGDLNRMEAGYLEPEREGVACGGLLDHSPLHEAAKATGVEIEAVRRVLAYVFREQR